MEPVDHTMVIAGLDDAQREALIRRSDTAGLKHLVMHVGALALTTVLVVNGGAWRPVFMLVHGVLLTFLFTLLHETVHRTPFRSRWLNDAAGWTCGFLIFIEPRWFRSFHLAHHRYTNDPDHDPELAEPRPSTRLQYARYLSGIPDFVGRLRVLVANAAGVNADSFIVDKSRVSTTRRARLQIGLYAAVIVASVLLGTATVLFVWLLPYLMAGPFLRAYLLAEHADCPQTPSMFQNTRTILTNPVVRALAWNMPYHAEHHAFPAIPFHQLPAFHEHTKNHLAVVDPGYLAFNRTYLASLHQ